MNPPASSPRFRPGQSVTLAPNSRMGRIAPAVFEIVRIMPAEGRTTEYRLRDTKTGAERIMAENALIPAAMTQAGAAAAELDKLFGPR